MKSQESVKKTRLGDILLEKGLITNDQLQYAINVQKTSQLPIGEILVENKWISRRQIKQALNTQSKLRNAIFTSLLSLSPLALVGCGGAGQASPESTTSVEQVVNASQINSDDSLNYIPPVDLSSNDVISDDQNEVITGPISNTPADNLSSIDGNESVLVVGDSDPVEVEPVVVEEPEVVEQLLEEQLLEEQVLEEPVVVEELQEEQLVEEEPVIQDEVAALGSVQLSWMYPDKRMDGSDLYLYEIQGFRIYQLSTQGGIDVVYEVDGSDTDFIVENLEKGEYFFAITTVDSDGMESEFSEAISVPVS